MLQRLGGAGRFCDSQINISKINFLKECEAEQSGELVDPQSAHCDVLLSVVVMDHVRVLGPPAGHHYLIPPPSNLQHSAGQTWDKPVMSLKYSNKLPDSRLAKQRTFMKVVNKSSLNILLVEIGYIILASGHVMVISFIVNVWKTL